MFVVVVVVCCHVVRLEGWLAASVAGAMIRHLVGSTSLPLVQCLVARVLELLWRFSGVDLSLVRS